MDQLEIQDQFSPRPNLRDNDPMSIDDTPTDAELAQAITDEAEKGIEKIIVRSQTVGLLTWFIAGWPAAILAGFGEGLNQLINRRIYQRLSQLRDSMNARLNEVDSSKVNRNWFLSDEFQAMLFEAARQVTATADRKKILMLGNALVNSGITDFNDETRKELFLQMIRDLTPQHIAMLRRLLPRMIIASRHNTYGVRVAPLSLNRRMS